MSARTALPLQPPAQPGGPPLGGRLTASELIPLASTRIRMLRSRALAPLLMTALACALLFGIYEQAKTWGEYRVYFEILAIYMIAMIFFALYIYSGETKSLFWYAIPVAITYWQLGHVWNYYWHFFHEVLPGDTAHARGFANQFVAHFFGAGLNEELFKAVPALIALAVTLAVRSRLRNPLRLRGLMLEGPLDGLLFGAAAGATFIFDETVFDYVERVINQAKNNVGEGFFNGLTLLIPRVLQGVIGHMAWTGVFGYFIGLTVNHPRDGWKLIPLGWVLAASMHAFWNSAGAITPTYDSYLSLAITLPVFLSCLMKARQLEAVRLGLALDSRSILVSPRPAAPGDPTADKQTGLGSALTGLTTLIERGVGVRARATDPARDGTAASAPGLCLGVPGATYRLATAELIDLAGLFGAAGVPAGSRGIVGVSSAGRLVIRNAGAAAWTAVSPDGSTGTVAPGGDFQPEAGARLKLGAASLDVTAYAGAVA